MRIDDLIILGRTVPEQSKKYGIKVCSAGYSPEMRSFIRIYPLSVHGKPESREMITVDVERSKYDSRNESWALKTRDDKSILNSYGKITEINTPVVDACESCENLTHCMGKFYFAISNDFDLGCFLNLKE